MEEFENMSICKQDSTSAEMNQPGCFHINQERRKRADSEIWSPAIIFVSTATLMVPLIRYLVIAPSS